MKPPVPAEVVEEAVELVAGARHEARRGRHRERLPLPYGLARRLRRLTVDRDEPGEDERLGLRAGRRQPLRHQRLVEALARHRQRVRR